MAGGTRGVCVARARLLNSEQSQGVLCSVLQLTTRTGMSPLVRPVTRHRLRGSPVVSTCVWQVHLPTQHHPFLNKILSLCFLAHTHTQYTYLHPHPSLLTDTHTPAKYTHSRPAIYLFLSYTSVCSPRSALVLCLPSSFSLSARLCSTVGGVA